MKLSPLDLEDVPTSWSNYKTYLGVIYDLVLDLFHSWSSKVFNLYLNNISSTQYYFVKLTMYEDHAIIVNSS